MPRWKNDETVFAVSVSANGHSKSCRVPKPVLVVLGDPDRLVFVVDGRGRVSVRADGAGRKKNGGGRGQKAAAGRYLDGVLES